MYAGHVKICDKALPEIDISIKFILNLIMAPVLKSVSYGKISRGHVRLLPVLHTLVDREYISTTVWAASDGFIPPEMLFLITCGSTEVSVLYM
jgi:hypothetical protein